MAEEEHDDGLEPERRDGSGETPGILFRTIFSHFGGASEHDVCKPWKWFKSKANRAGIRKGVDIADNWGASGSIFY